MRLFFVFFLLLSVTAGTGCCPVFKAASQRYAPVASICSTLLLISSGFHGNRFGVREANKQRAEKDNAQNKCEGEMQPELYWQRWVQRR